MIIHDVFSFEKPLQSSSDSEGNRSKGKKKEKDARGKYDSTSEKKGNEEGEWSEDELERKRRLLLEQLAEEHQ